MSSLPKLETKHWAWIFQAAAEDFAAKIRETELDIVRHRALVDLVIATPHASRNQDREKEIARLNAQWLDYHNILENLRAMRDRITDVSAEEFARAFKASRK